MREGRDGSVFACLQRWSADADAAAAVVVGLPLTADGREERRSPARPVASPRVLGRPVLPVTLFDERYTSQEARTDPRADAGASRRAVDALAAEIILQGFLDRRSAAAEIAA